MSSALAIVLATNLSRLIFLSGESSSAQVTVVGSPGRRDSLLGQENLEFSDDPRGDLMDHFGGKRKEADRNANWEGGGGRGVVDGSNLGGAGAENYGGKLKPLERGDSWGGDGGKGFGGGFLRGRGCHGRGGRGIPLS
ncbi:hypothetical protein GUJ93_ZPchr0013g38026 [Zizania palustris]|uniref:Uncharacterized protein n=1 Tax=Zizania palustris TaxID=103762 RepID=A0A8J5X510_ZIZPA|nr:hypothetical protein GUJ93_ZPchr0013g38026 [Zizania palustris]